MSHYFSNDYNKSNKRKLTVIFNDSTFVFNSDDNVFSKNGIDFGSKFLVSTILNDTDLKGKALDIGCGYGTIAMLLAKFNECQFVACDVNERAVALAEENAKENGLNNKIKTIVSDVCDAVSDTDFDFVISNPPIRAGNKVLDKFFAQSYDKLKQGGVSYWVFRKQQGAPTYTKKLNAIYGNAEIVDKEKSYWVVKCVK